MPEENEKSQVSKGTSAPTVDPSLEVTFNKSTQEMTLRDPDTGRLVTIKANVIESEDEEDSDEDFQPLTSSAFREALQKVADLGLMWSADPIPRVVPLNEKAESALLSEEYRELEKAYPSLPRELSAVVYHALTGAPAYDSIVGPPDDLKQKVSAVRDLVLTSSYRAEFFFKYALKVPYFESVDWEVVFKTHERNVKGMPAVGYALLMLTFHNTNASVRPLNTHENVTVAVDLPLVNKLIRTFVDIKTGLEDVQKLSERFAEAEKVEDTDGTNG